jgi:type I restriction enzyme S subunit
MWKTVKLGDVCTVTNGSTPLRKEKRYWEEGNIPWFTIDDFRVQGKNIRYTKQNVTQAAVDDKKVRLVPANSVLLCCTASIGVTAIARVPMATNQQFNALTPKSSSLNSDYLYFVATTLTKNLLSVSGSTTINFVSMSKLKNISIPLPPLEEQKRIVAKLDAAFAEIDEAIVATKHKQENARKLYEAIARDIFFNKKNKVPLKEIAKIIMGQSPKGESYNSVGIGSVLINGPVEFEKDSFGLTKSIKFTNAPTKFCEMGDALLCVRGSTTGRMNIAREHACIGRGVAAIRANQNQDWINYFIQSSRTYIYSIGTGATFPNVSSKQIENIEIYYPSIEEQESLLSRLSGSYSETKRYAELTKNILNNYKALKSAILTQELQSEAA